MGEMLFLVVVDTVNWNEAHIKVAFRSEEDRQGYWARVPDRAKSDARFLNCRIQSGDFQQAGRVYALVVRESPPSDVAQPKRVISLHPSLISAAESARSMVQSTGIADLEALFFSFGPTQVGMHSASISSSSNAPLLGWAWQAHRGVELHAGADGWTAEGFGMTPQEATQNAQRLFAQFHPSMIETTELKDA